MCEMSDTLLKLPLPTVCSRFRSSPSVSRLPADPILKWRSWKKSLALVSSMGGEVGMKVTSSCSKGLMVTVMRGWELPPGTSPSAPLSPVKLSQHAAAWCRPTSKSVHAGDAKVGLGAF